MFLAGAGPVPGIDWQALLFFGTVRRDGEDLSSPRVVEAAGHAAIVLYHFVAENRLPAELVPGLEEWLRSYDDVPADERHLAIHDLHLIGINDHDRPFVTPQLLEASGNVWSPAELRDRIASLESDGVTEIAYQPAGDIPAELEAFATAARG